MHRAHKFTSSRHQELQLRRELDAIKSKVCHWLRGGLIYSLDLAVKN